jgi:hypothetical protein
MSNSCSTGRVKLMINVAWYSVVFYATISVALWVLMGYVSYAIIDYRADGKTLWYAITWIPFTGTSVFVGYKHAQYASSLLMCFTFVLIVFLFASKGVDDGIVFWEYCSGVFLLILIASSIARRFAARAGASKFGVRRYFE